MTATVWWVVGICGALALPSGWGQKVAPAAAGNLKVVVLDAHVDPGKPVEAARVSLVYLDGSGKVPLKITDRRDSTNARGEAFLVVSQAAMQSGRDVRVEVEEQSGKLAIFEPADGQLPASFMAKPVTVTLLPKGSEQLRGPGHIEALLRRLSVQVSSLEAQSRKQQNALAAAQAKKDDLATAMADWAKANGFPADETDRKVQEWAEDVQRRAQSASNEQMALAQFALKNYGAAGKLFETAADDEDAAYEQHKKAVQEQEHKVLLQSISKSVSDSQRSANAYQLALQYGQATAVLKKTADRLERAHSESNTDEEIADLWLRSVWELASARQDEGEFSAPSASSLLLGLAVEDYERLAVEYAGRSDRQDWAAMQNNLGNAFLEQGERTSGSESAALFGRAVEAYDHALEIRTKADLPQAWAGTQNNLGNALTAQGERTIGSASAVFFGRAVEGYEHALEIFTKADLPQNWAGTQNNLGIALMEQGERTGGSASAVFFGRAVEAYEHALEIFTKADLPQNWAGTQNNLGLALQNQGERTSGSASAALFGRAVEAYEHALEIDTKADLPQDWAATENNLGLALQNQGERTSGSASTGLLGRAVEAYEHALEIYTKTDLPQDWAMTLENLGDTLRVQGERTSGPASTALLGRAVEAYEHALEIRTKVDLPQGWATTQYNLGKARADQNRYAEAVKAFESVLEVYPQEVSALGPLSAILHEDIFDFGRAYDLDKQRVKLDPSSSNKMDLLEASLTAGHFDRCLADGVGIEDAALEAQQIPVRNAIILACAWGAGDRPRALQDGRALVGSAAFSKEPGWTFDGTVHFLAESPVFEKGRTAWVALFTSLQRGDGAGMAGALKELEPVFEGVGH